MKIITKLVIITLLTITSACSTIIGSFNKEPIKASNDERTLGQWMDDQTSETIAIVNIQKSDPDFKDSRIKAISFNGILLLIGQVPKRKLITLASDTAKHITQLKQVHNELTIGSKTNLLEQASDTWVTARVKTGLISSDDVIADRIKVITEQGTVYLMGLVTPEVAKATVDIVRKTPGVKKLLKYLSIFPPHKKKHQKIRYPLKMQEPNR